MKNYLKIVSCAVIGLTATGLHAQNVAINSTGTAAAASAMLDITSTNSGILIPRMTAAQRAAISSPATSLVVYQTDAGTLGSGFYFYNGTAWVPWGTNNGGWGLAGNTGTASGTNYLGTTDGQALDFRTNASIRFRVANGDQVYAMADGSGALPFYSWGSETNLGFFRNGAGSIGISTSGTARAAYYSDGTYLQVPGAAGAGYDGSEIESSPGEGVGVGAIWALNPSPAGAGSGYGTASINYGVLGMIAGTARQYSFGLAGQTTNANRCGGVFGMSPSATAWGTLGYRASNGSNYGAYFSAAAGSGGGFNTTSATSGIGTGTYADFIGSVTRGEIIGQITTGELFASYNIGNEFTSGYKADIVTGANGKTAAYSNSSGELKIYSDGTTNLSSGEVFVAFDAAFMNLYAKTTVPTITVSPMGECNGLYISKVEQNGFWVRELNHGGSNVSFSWIAIGKRIDNAEVPADILAADFDQNVKNSVVNENNPQINAKPMWWNGSKIVFNTPVPEAKPVGKLKMAPQTQQIPVGVRTIK